MDTRTGKEMILYKRRIHHFREKHFSTPDVAITIAAVIDLTLIIPAALIGPVKIKYTEFIILNNNFEDIIDYLNWLDTIAQVIEKESFFTAKQSNALSDHRNITLENFLTDKQAMFYYPHVILSNVHSKLIKIQRVLLEVTHNKDMYDYYVRRLKGYMTMISQPIFAIGELAGMTHE